MVDAAIEAQFTLDKAAFVRSAGNADDARARAFGELADDRADRARGGRDDDGLAALRPADLAEPDIGGKPRHAEHAERRRQRSLGRVELEQALCRHGAVELPAVTAIERNRLRESPVARAHDLPDDPALHDRTDLDRLGIGARPR